MFNYYGNHIYRKNSFVCFYLDYVVCLVVSVVAFVIYVIGIKHVNVSCWLTLSIFVSVRCRSVRYKLQATVVRWSGCDVTRGGYRLAGRSVSRRHHDCNCRLPSSPSRAAVQRKLYEFGERRFKLNTSYLLYSDNFSTLSKSTIQHIIIYTLAFF